MSKLNKHHPLYQEDLHRICTKEVQKFFAGKRFAITGATGLLGVQLIDALMLIENITIYAFGRSTEKAKERLGEYFHNHNFYFIECDVQHELPYVEVDYILPLASNTHPIAYSQYPVETILLNTRGCENALELARKTGAEVLYPSSVEVYGNAWNENDVFTEDYVGRLDLSTARAGYPESKRVCETLCLSYMQEYGVQVKIVRLSRIFGPTMLLDDSKASSQFIKNALNRENVVLKSNGQQRYSYTYVADAVAAMLHILQYGKSGDAYNISNNSCIIKLKDFAALCAKEVRKDVIFNMPSTEEYNGYSAALNAILSNEKLKQIGFTASVAIEEGIKRTIKIFKSKNRRMPVND